jgi:hypothetical protein
MILSVSYDLAEARNESGIIAALIDPAREYEADTVSLIYFDPVPAGGTPA